MYHPMIDFHQKILSMIGILTSPTPEYPPSMTESEIDALADSIGDLDVSHDTISLRDMFDSIEVDPDIKETPVPWTGSDSIDAIKIQLSTFGYCVIPDALSIDEVDESVRLMKEWQETIPNHDRIHSAVNPHGIYKFHDAGHQEHAWFIRTRTGPRSIFEELWATKELTVSFDGSCFIPKTLSKKDKCWTHSDQAPKTIGLACYQGFVAMTSNRERTFVVYPQSHLVHHQYFSSKGSGESPKNWQLVDPVDLEGVRDRRKPLEVPSGALVIWDSRTFHQNQYGSPGSEERRVQYVCYLPRNGKKNSAAMKKKRLKYFEDRRTTSHWPYPLRVNGKQPQTYGDKSREIHYEDLRVPDLTRFRDDIEELIQ